MLSETSLVIGAVGLVFLLIILASAVRQFPTSLNAVCRMVSRDFYPVNRTFQDGILTEAVLIHYNELLRGPAEPGIQPGLRSFHLVLLHLGEIKFQHVLFFVDIDLKHGVGLGINVLEVVVITDK